LGSGYGKLACFVRVAAGVAVTVALGADSTPSKKELLKRAAAYVDQQVELLPQLVAQERSSQTVRSGAGSPTPSRVITTRADFGWVQLDGVNEAIGVRDVREADGKPVGGEGRLEELLRQPPSGRIAAAQAILAESARYNIGPISRNLNLPTTALFFLQTDRQTRFSWKVDATDAGQAILAFKERERPTVIRGLNNEPVFSRGRIWIDQATGTVERTELRAEVPDPESRSTWAYFLAVEFATDPGLKLMLPRRMQERYEARATVVTGQAEYVNYRRFQTEGRIIH
jgi:hypothetical protein